MHKTYLLGMCLRITKTIFKPRLAVANESNCTMKLSKRRSLGFNVHITNPDWETTDTANAMKNRATMYIHSFIERAATTPATMCRNVNPTTAGRRPNLWRNVNVNLKKTNMKFKKKINLIARENMNLNIRKCLTYQHWTTVLTILELKPVAKILTIMYNRIKLGYYYGYWRLYFFLSQTRILTTSAISVLRHFNETNVQNLLDRPFAIHMQSTGSQRFSYIVCPLEYARRWDLLWFVESIYSVLCGFV